MVSVVVRNGLASSFWKLTLTSFFKSSVTMSSLSGPTVMPRSGGPLLAGFLIWNAYSRSLISTASTWRCS